MRDSKKSPLYEATIKFDHMPQDDPFHNEQIGKPERIGLVDVKATPVDLHAGEMCGESE